jgi:two-component system, OmpR family, KDP operon response regulator KdpE
MKNQPRIMVLDDELPIRRFLRASLTSHGYDVLDAEAGEEAIRLATIERPDVMIVDLGLPDIDGIEVIRRIREWSDVPIIVLSVREREDDKIEALDSGADDYVTKPFGMGELLARIRTALRHKTQAESEEPQVQIGDLIVDLARRTVSVDCTPVKLTPKEYDLLRILANHVGRVCTQRKLLEEVWGPSHVRHTHYLRIYMQQIRRKIERNPAHPQYIVTEPGVGYRLQESPHTTD